MNMFSNTMADMKWTDIQRHADENAVVLLPMGVIEEHGPHLCLATDIYTAHITCLAVQKKLEKESVPAIIAPPFYWGICQAGKGFIGSFNIRPETMKALLFDIFSSLRDFGFQWAFGINTHGDVEHKTIAVNACKDACEQLGITVCFPYDEFMTQLLGFNQDAPYFYEIKPSEINVSTAEVPDVHAGDIETAIINAHYPHLVDRQIAKALPDAALGDQFEAWMFGNQLKQISPQGYMGSPRSYESVNAAQYIKDSAHRISQAILARLNKSKGFDNS